MLSRLPLWSKGLVLGALMALVLAACGSNEPTNTPTIGASATPTNTLAPGQTPTATQETSASPTPDGFDAAAYFKGKTIKIVANSSPGGGTDSQGRVMAAYLSKWIPGNPRVVFTNQPNKPQEYVFAATDAPKDGTYISWNSTPQLNYGFEEQTQNIKRSSFEFIGATIDSTRSWMTYDPVGNLGAAAADKCLWDFAGMESTGGGQHGKFLLADEITDVREGNPTTIASLYVVDTLGIPFDYFAFDKVDTNSVYTMWARGDINTTVRASVWYRIPLEHPEWIPAGKLRVYANMGPGELGANQQTEPHCGPITEHLSEEQAHIYKALNFPTNYMSKALWAPPGTPDNVADALSAAFETAFEQDTEMVEKYAAVAGEEPRFTDRDTGTEQTAEAEALFADSVNILAEQSDILLTKYFPQYYTGN